MKTLTSDPRSAPALGPDAIADEEVTEARDYLTAAVAKAADAIIQDYPGEINRNDLEDALRCNISALEAVVESWDFILNKTARKDPPDEPL